MCDYSLENVASRPAKAGDRVVSTKFQNAITRGFSGVDDPTVAVCLLPGTELAFDKEVTYYSRFSSMPDMKTDGCVARFRQVDLDKRHVHHDALEFSDGRIVHLARLAEGQIATVIQMPHLTQPVATAAEIKPTTTIRRELLGSF